MTIRVATVLSAREWEPALVAHATETAALRIVLRAFQPRDIESNAESIDVVIASGDVTWVTPHLISAWRRLGLGVVGVYPEGDDPASSLLELGGANEVVSDGVDMASLVQTVRFAAPDGDVSTEASRGHVTGVVGTRGAPGCTEIAVAIAVGRASISRVVLIDADLDAPSLAVRLGIAPRPDLIDAADMVRAEGVFDGSVIRRVGAFDVIPGSHRDAQAAVRMQMVGEVVSAAAAVYPEVIVDLGTGDRPDDLLDAVDDVVLVMEGSPVGIVRAATTTKEWFGPTPSLVLNKVAGRSSLEVVDAARRWTGLDPIAVIPHRDGIRRSASSGRQPQRSLVKALQGVGAR